MVPFLLPSPRARIGRQHPCTCEEMRTCMCMPWAALITCCAGESGSAVVFHIQAPGSKRIEAVSLIRDPSLCPCIYNAYSNALVALSIPRAWGALSACTHTCRMGRNTNPLGLGGNGAAGGTPKKAPPPANAYYDAAGGTPTKQAPSATPYYGAPPQQR